MTEILDLKGVFPLFNTETCVSIRRMGTLHSDNVPTKRYRAQLPYHQMSLADAQAQMEITRGESRLLGEVSVRSPYYYDRFKSGANLYPRNLCYVRPRQRLQPGDAAVNPVMESDPDVDREAKVPWKGVRLEGQVFAPYLYATLLSKNLVPFGFRRLHLVALPARMDAEGALRMMEEHDFLAAGDIRCWQTWFEPAERKWNELKKETTGESLTEWLNYHNKLTDQSPFGAFKVLYNASGTHPSSCVIDTRGTAPKVYEYPVQGFIVDVTTYSFKTVSESEAHYLCSILNAPCVDQEIKAYQTRGIYKGERHIHRRPFEACAIPQFDPGDPAHLQLAELSKESHRIILGAALEGSVYKARDLAREAVAAQIAAIDEIARRILGL